MPRLLERGRDGRRSVIAESASERWPDTSTQLAASI
jgi:hypothetical protein